MIIDLNKVISLDILKRHLLPLDSDAEHAVFLFAKNKGLLLIVEGFLVLEAKDFDIQSSYHIQVKSETIGKLIKQAHDTKASLIEIHSHIDQPQAKFSFSDWAGFDDFVPHIKWRLPNRPYAALVFADDSIDGLYWDDNADDPKPIEKIIDGKNSIYTTNLSTKPGNYYE